MGILIEGDNDKATLETVVSRNLSSSVLTNSVLFSHPEHFLVTRFC